MVDYPQLLCVIFGLQYKAAVGHQWERAEALLDDMQSRGLDTSGVLLFGEPGAEIIYPDPGFPIYRSMIEYTGATPVPLLEAP